MTNVNLWPRPLVVFVEQRGGQLGQLGGAHPGELVACRLARAGRRGRNDLPGQLRLVAPPSR
jgi:hypothetical protein